jgi:hypothetical protein
VEPSHPIERYESERQWGEYFGGKVRDHLDPAIPKADAADLKTAAEKVKRYVDENVAHTARAPKEPAVSLQLADVHEAVKTVDRLFRRYYGLLKCGGLDDNNARRAGRLLRTVPRAVDAGGLHSRTLAPHSYSPMSQPASRRCSIM